ncbi:MAG: CaiB/BaiF CoA-transferase family protein [Candidatus Marinimicrobia bacterium]|jgi:CoA:oxalate CoA-transferase|nr:CaiB/BaiF CoA-transferase family protein [Candidatus Neomarinimicrobiota bacterium]
MAKPLEGIKVLDLTRVLAGPFCTMVLSDLGAEVIKVEIPKIGDDSRYFGPFKNEQSLYFLSLNRAKKSITLNLKTAEGKTILKDLVKDFDVLVENYRPGTMEKLGVGYDILKEINPNLIYAASSGFGHSGPDSKKPAYDLLAQARGGIMSITGWPDTPPTRVGMSTGDITASLFTAIGISSALFQREKNGKGQKIDVAMIDCQVAILENALARYQVNGKSPTPLGNRHPTITPFQAFKAKDDYFVLPIGNNNLWKKFCEAIDREELITDSKFATNDVRTKNLEILTPLLDDIFITKTVSQWVELLEDKGIPCGPINSIDEVMKDEQILARNMIVEVEDDRAGTTKIAGNPIKMTSIPEEKKREPAPKIGEHTKYVLEKYLKFDDEKINQLHEDGVI